MKRLFFFITLSFLSTGLYAQSGRLDSMLYKKNETKNISANLLATIKSNNIDASSADVIIVDKDNSDYQFDYLLKRDGAKNVYLFSESKPMVKVSSDRNFIGVLSDGNLFLTDVCQEKTEQFTCSNIVKVDKNGTVLKLTSDLSKYIYIINMSVNSFVADNKRYVIVFNPSSSNYNIIDESGRPIFDIDRSTIVRLYSSYILVDGNEIYNLTSKKKLAINPDYKYISSFPAHKLILFAKKSDRKYVVYDLKDGQPLFESEQLVSEIPHTSEATVKHYLYVGDIQNSNIINLKGEKISADYYKRAVLKENGNFWVENLENQVNILNPKTKKYVYEEFYDEINSDIYFDYLKKGANYQITDKSGKIIYSFDDHVTLVPQVYGNMRYFTKSGKKHDVYLIKDNTLLFKDVEYIRDIQDSNGFFIIIRIAPMKNIIVDQDGKVLVSERPIEGYLRYNSSNGTFEVSKKRDGKPYLTLNKSGEEVKI